MSRMYTGAPFTVLIGMSFIADISSGLLLSRIRYSRVPTFTVPVGRIRF